MVLFVLISSLSCLFCCFHCPWWRLRWCKLLVPFWWEPCWGLAPGGFWLSWEISWFPSAPTGEFHLWPWSKGIELPCFWWLIAQWSLWLHIGLFSEFFYTYSGINTLFNIKAPKTLCIRWTWKNLDSPHLHTLMLLKFSHNILLDCFLLWVFIESSCQKQVSWNKTENTVLF